MQGHVRKHGYDIVRKPFIAGLGAVFLLTACVPNGSQTTQAPNSAVVTQLAQNGRLSRDAMSMQAGVNTLASLETRQAAATKRTSSYGTQGAVAGAIVGGILGYLACMNCNDRARAAAVVAGASGGGYLGNRAGESQAATQNTAAEQENALKERIQIASAQLSQSKTVSAQANKILATHQRELARLQGQVKAGRASVARLEAARANAASDAMVIQNASKALNTTNISISNEIAQDKSGRLAAAAADTKKDLAQTDIAYSALVASINSSAL